MFLLVYGPDWLDQPMNINQERIARQLNISRATVSRSLSNHPSISAATRASVLQVAAKFGYRSSPGRTLHRRRTGKPLTIGVLIAVSQANTPIVRARSEK